MAILCFCLLLLAGYLVFIKLQIRSMNMQLSRRLAEHARQPVSTGLLDKGLNKLAVNINNCLKAEENLRLSMFKREKRFKEMIADISHDLRTPLTAIKGYQQLIEKDTLSPEQRRKLNIAQKHADELGVLIEHFFEYSFLTDTDTKPRSERLNLTNITAECLAEYVTMFEEKHLTVHFDEPEPIFIFADKEMVTRIIRNLIRNCIQHSGSDVEVRLTASQMAELSFKNAVDKEEIDVNRIFDRFYTADKARRGGNAGLGLSIVKILTEKMGGKTDAAIQDGFIEIKVELPVFDKSARQDND